MNVKEFERPDLSNFKYGKVSEIIPDKLYLTDLDGAEKSTKNTSFTCVISLMTTDQHFPVYPKHVLHHKFVIADSEKSTISGILTKTTHILTSLQKFDKALVHCMAGISRSSTVVIAYLMKEMNLDVMEAYSYVKRCREWICPNPKFQTELMNKDF